MVNLSITIVAGIAALGGPRARAASTRFAKQNHARRSSPDQRGSCDALVESASKHVTMR
jgi:hypothetical protein